jgi:hypothetical protein
MRLTTVLNALFKKHIKENCHENINQIFVKVVIKIFKQHMDEYYSNKLFTLFLSIILLNYITLKKLLAMNDAKHRDLEQIQFESDSQMLVEKIRTKWRDNL